MKETTGNHVRIGNRTCETAGGGPEEKLGHRIAFKLVLHVPELILDWPNIGPSQTSPAEISPYLALVR